MTNWIARLVRAAAGRPSAQPPQQAAARAVVIDLDNIGQPRAGHARPVLEALLAACGPHAVVIASGRDCSFDAYEAACRSLGVRAFLSPSVRNGADQALLATAGALHAAGIEHFTVISGDHAFARLPGTVEVVMPAGRPVAQKLALHAASVTAVELPAAPVRRTSRRRQTRKPAALTPAVPAVAAA